MMYVSHLTGFSFVSSLLGCALGACDGCECGVVMGGDVEVLSGRRWQRVGVRV